MEVLGIDAGGSKTVALRGTLDGTVLAEARSGGANLRTDGELIVEKTLHDVIESVLPGDAPRPAAVCLGMAGVDRADDAGVIRGVMRRLGFREQTLIVNDALVALVAGAGEPRGLVIVAGTGSIAYGVNAAGRAARAGGWGPVLADEGSGYWIGRRALVAIMRQADGRGAPTALTPLVLRHLGVDRAEELVQEVYEGPERRQLVAMLGPVVAEAARGGDVVASDILRDAADELVAAARSVVTRLAMRGDAFATFLAGGMFRSVPWLANEVSTRLLEVAPRSTTALLAVEPARGALRLAAAAARGEARVPAYAEFTAPSS